MVRNEVTYTVRGREERVSLMSRHPLTVRGAERLVRARYRRCQSWHHSGNHDMVEARDGLAECQGCGRLAPSASMVFVTRVEALHIR